MSQLICSWALSHVHLYPYFNVDDAICCLCIHKIFKIVLMTHKHITHSHRHNDNLRFSLYKTFSAFYVLKNEKSRKIWVKRNHHNMQISFAHILFTLRDHLFICCLMYVLYIMAKICYTQKAQKVKKAQKLLWKPNGRVKYKTFFEFR